MTYNLRKQNRGELLQTKWRTKSINKIACNFYKQNGVQLSRVLTFRQHALHSRSSFIYLLGNLLRVPSQENRLINAGNMKEAYSVPLSRLSYRQCEIVNYILGKTRERKTIFRRLSGAIALKTREKCWKISGCTRAILKII